MTVAVVSIRPDATVTEAARRMHKANVKRLPVIGEGGRLVGIISRRDLLTVFNRPDAAIRREIMDEVEERVVEDVLARLRRIEGQVGGLIRMVESGRECRDVVRQVSAASRALDQVGFKILACGLRVCARDAAAAEQAGYTEEELEKLFLRLA